jgi:hypothetical protein
MDRLKVKYDNIDPVPGSKRKIWGTTKRERYGVEPNVGLVST